MNGSRLSCFAQPSFPLHHYSVFAVLCCLACPVPFRFVLQVKLLFKHTATRNTALFHRVFPALPHHSYRTLKDYNLAILKKRARRPSEEQSALYLNEVRGVVCNFPVGFLAEEEAEGVIGPFGASITKAQIPLV